MGSGYGSFGVRFDNSPAGVTVRADDRRVVADGFGNRDKLYGINAFVGSPFSDYIRGGPATSPSVTRRHPLGATTPTLAAKATTRWCISTPPTSTV